MPPAVKEMSSSIKSSPSGSRSSSQSFISRFWRQKLSSNHASPAYPPPPEQSNWMLAEGPVQQQPYGMDHTEQPLEPPWVVGYTMPVSMSPDASPHPNPPGPPLSNFHAAYSGYPAPNPNRQAPVGQIHIRYGQVQTEQPGRLSPQNPYLSTFPFNAPSLPPHADTKTLAPDPNPSVPALLVPVSASTEPSAVAVNPTHGDADQKVVVVELSTGSAKGKSPDLHPQDLPRGILASPSIPRDIGIATFAPPVSTIPLEASPGFSLTTPTDGFLPGPKPNPGAHRVVKTAETIETDAGGPTYYNTNKPTCSLNLVCYRSGAKGCELQQIQGILRSKYSNDEGFEAVKTATKGLISTDYQFFHEMERLYETKMCSFLRRNFSLKSLKAFRVLAVSLRLPFTVIYTTRKLTMNSVYARN